jgi:hypothetical protein
VYANTVTASSDSSDSSNSTNAADSIASSKEGSSSTAAPQLMLPNLRHLELTAVQLGSISSLLQLTNAPQLTSLMLDSIGVLDF